MVDDKEITAVGFPEGTSADGPIMYTRRKRRKTTHLSDEITTSGFIEKLKAADGSSFNQYVHRLSFDALSNGSGECSLTNYSNTVLPQRHQSLNGHGGCIQNTLVTCPESGCTPVIKESLDKAERSDNQTHNSAQESSHVLSGGLLKQSEASTDSKLCGRALSDILNSEKFSELCSLLLENVGVVNVNQVLGVDGISSKLNNGAYETSPMLYLKDIQQVWTKLQQVGNEMVTLAKSLSDKSRAYYEQYVRKLRTAEPCGCQKCGEKADVKNCLVCVSCENIYHLSCTELAGTPIPPKSWYCASCVSNGIGPPHDNCVVCEKLKAPASIALVNGVPTNNQSEDVHVLDGLDEHLHNDTTDESQSIHICFICKSQVKLDDNLRICRHSVCSHKFYHSKCLTSQQLGVYGPYWYCPSCLCRCCLVDKDDNQIVLCDGCDHAYHIYCTSPQLDSIPKGNWFCGKCEGVKEKTNQEYHVREDAKESEIEDESEKDVHEASVDELLKD